jgi:5,5'-dehydrodivanillate O-demethylase
VLSAQRQETLTRVGPGTPMGELLRRYWHPAAASAEIEAGETRAVRLLGEDLVLFRCTDGALGLLDERCPHRGASLRHGCVDDGIRCPYHGLKLAPSGACLEIPFERRARGGGAPAGAGGRADAARTGSAARGRVGAATEPTGPTRLRATAYRVEELGGLVFAYLGPEPAPLLPRFDLLVWEGVLRDIGRATIPCNWLQIMENSVDPIHVEWLHGRHLAAVRSRDGKPAPARYPRRHERIGFSPFRFGIIKRRVLEGGSEEDDDWRVGHPLVFPNMVRVGAHRQHRLQIRVPADDTHTEHYWYSCYRPPEGVVLAPQERVPVYEVPFRDERGAFILDFVDGGDIMTWVTQGPIADRRREHLLESDEGIVLLRRMLLEQIERVRRGEDPLGLVRDPAENRLIELPQERDKYGDGAAFLREAIELSHVRYSPLRDRIAELLRDEDTAG